MRRLSTEAPADERARTQNETLGLRGRRAWGSGRCRPGWAGYAAVAWSRYGRVSRAEETDALLDRYMPLYEVGERHAVRVAAPASATYQAALDLDLQRSAIVRAIFRGRELLLGAQRGKRSNRRFLDEIASLGWQMLADEPGREMVFGAATQPWKADVRFRGLPPDTFAEFDEPGYVKIAWTLSVEPQGSEESIFRTETRAVATDAEARRRFRRYWSIFSPGIVLIRREILRVVKAEAERRASLARSRRLGGG